MLIGIRKFRAWARSPASTLLVLVSLVAGIGASTTMFRIFDAVFLRKLAVRRPEDLVQLVQPLPGFSKKRLFPFAAYDALRSHARTVEVFGETGHHMHFRMAEPRPPSEVTVHAVTSNFFATLGVRALVGRTLIDSDSSESSRTPAAVLSYEFWKLRFERRSGRRWKNDHHQQRSIYYRRRDAMGL